MAQKGLFLLLLLGISSIDITESTNKSAAGNDFELIMVCKKNKNYHGSQFTGSNNCSDLSDVPTKYSPALQNLQLSPSCPLDSGLSHTILQNITNWFNICTWNTQSENAPFKTKHKNKNVKKRCNRLWGRCGSWSESWRLARSRALDHTALLWTGQIQNVSGPPAFSI